MDRPIKSGDDKSMSIHHLAIQTANLETLKDFYQKVLELPLFQTQKMPDGHVRAYWFELNPGVLMIEENNTPPSSLASRHVVIFSTNPQERKTWEDKLTQNKIAITHQTEFTFYFNDPDENPLGFSHYPHKAE